MPQVMMIMPTPRDANARTASAMSSIRTDAQVRALPRVRMPSTKSSTTKVT
jgi:hypothetical protein